LASRARAPHPALRWVILSGWRASCSSSWAGCLFLSIAHERLHHARVSGAPFQPALCRLPGGHLDHRLHLHQDFCPALRCSVVLERIAGWHLVTTAIVLVIATGIYTVAGGLAAVIYTDTVQTLILITGAVALTVIGLHRVGGLEHLRSMVPPGYFHMIKPASDPSFPWTGIFFGAPILGIWYWCTDQVIVQRVLSARDEGHAKAGTIFAGFLKILPVFMLVLPGIIAFALFPDQVSSKPDYAYPTLVLNLLPTGLVGLVMAALLAAVMGAMSSVFNSASTLVTLDFYKKIRPRPRRTSS